MKLRPYKQLLPRLVVLAGRAGDEFEAVAKYVKFEDAKAGALHALTPESWGEVDPYNIERVRLALKFWLVYLQDAEDRSSINAFTRASGRLAGLLWIVQEDLLADEVRLGRFKAAVARKVVDMIDSPDDSGPDAVAQNVDVKKKRKKASARAVGVDVHLEGGPAEGLAAAPVAQAVDEPRVVRAHDGRKKVRRGVRAPKDVEPARRGVERARANRHKVPVAGARTPAVDELRRAHKPRDNKRSPDVGRKVTGRNDGARARGRSRHQKSSS